MQACGATPRKQCMHPICKSLGRLFGPLTRCAAGRLNLSPPVEFAIAPCRFTCGIPFGCRPTVPRSCIAETGLGAWREHGRSNVHIIHSYLRSIGSSGEPCMHANTSLLYHICSPMRFAGSREGPMPKAGEQFFSQGSR